MIHIFNPWLCITSFQLKVFNDYFKYDDIDANSTKFNEKSFKDISKPFRVKMNINQKYSAYLMMNFLHRDSVFQSSYLYLLLKVVGLLWLRILRMKTDELIWQEQFFLFLHTISQFVFELNCLLMNWLFQLRSKSMQILNHLIPEILLVEWKLE